MTSEIRVNKITNRAGLSTVEYTDTGIVVSGIITATEISGLSALSIAGVGTASALDINGDIDIDGHTNLDNLSIAGVTTFSNSVNFANGTLSRTSTGSNLIFQTDLETRLFHSSNNNVKLTFYGSGETLRGSVEAQATQIQIKDSGGRSGLVVAHGAESRLYFNDVEKFRTTNTGAVVTGILTATSFSGNPAGTSSLDAGILDLKTGGNLRLRFSSGGEAQFRGDTDPIASFDRGSANSTNVKWGYLGADRGIISSISNEFRIAASGTTPMTFHSNGTERLRIIPAGINVTGIVTATSFSGDGSSLSNLPAGAPVGGASTNTVFFENDTAVAVNYQVTSGKNAMSAGPIAINAGIAVTVPSGSSWTII